jgi:hypothetical protein
MSLQAVGVPSHAPHAFSKFSTVFAPLFLLKKMTGRKTAETVFSELFGRIGITIQLIVYKGRQNF